MSQPANPQQQQQQQDPFAEFGGNASEASQAPTVPAGTPQTPSSPATSLATPASSSDPFAEFGGHEAGSSDQTSNDPRQTGEITNDVGQKVIVPKDGEAFADTLKRAVAYHKSLTPEQQKAALDAETKTMPKKAAQTLGAAATIGVAGPALLATAGEAGLAAKNFVLKQLAAQTPELFGHEAVKETLKRYALEGVKKAMTGAAWAGGAELLHSIWDDVFDPKKK
jgi:hypothetical protein